MSSSETRQSLGGNLRKTANTIRGLLSLALIAALGACSSGPENPAKDTNPLLYEIVGPQGDTEGWMLGTIHLLPDGVAWRTDAIDSAVADADMLVVEIADLDDRDEIARVFVELGTTHGLPAIAQRVAPSQRPALLRLIEDAGMSPSDFTAIETWAAALTLAQSNSLGSARNGVDRAILSDFEGRDIVEFEGAVEQLTIFDALAEDDQRVLLNSTISESEQGTSEARSLLRAWLTGDVDALEQATTSGAMEDPEVRAALLVDRNRAWMRKLMPLLQTPEKPLIAVGAAHLVGPDGLPAMLEERGYAIRRLGH